MLCCLYYSVLVGHWLRILRIDWMGMDRYDNTLGLLFWVLGIYGGISSKNFSHNKRVYTIFLYVPWRADNSNNLNGLDLSRVSALSYYGHRILARVLEGSAR